jgi:hypothetical protein
MGRGFASMANGNFSGGLTQMASGAGALGAVAGWGLKGIYNEIMEDPNRFLKYQAQLGQARGTEIMPLAQGDFRRQMALNDVMADPSKRKDYEALNGGFRRFLSVAPGALWHGVTAQAGLLEQDLSGHAGDMMVRAEMQKQVDMEQESDPFRNMIRGQMQDYRGRLSTARALGIGAGPSVKGKPGTLMKSINKLLQAYGGTWSEGEIGAAYGAIESTGARGGRGSLAGGVMHGTVAGIGGIGQTVGAVSKFGAGGAFLNAMLSGAGGGGIDPTTMGDLGGAVARTLNAYSMQGTTGLGLLGALQSGVTGGAEGRLIGEQNIAGIGGLQRIIGGDLDPYQKARNLQMAITAAPTSGIYAQNYLATGMNIGNLADIAAGKGEINPIASAMGITKENAKEMLSGMTGSIAERFLQDPMAADTDMGKVFASISESGMDPTEWFKSGKFRQLGMSKEKAVAGFAAGIKGEAGAENDKEAMGMSRLIAGMGAGPKEGWRAGDSAGKSSEGETSKTNVELMGEAADGATTELGKFTTALSMAVMALQLLSDPEMNKKAGSKARLDEALFDAFSKNPHATRADVMKELNAKNNAEVLEEQAVSGPLKRARERETTGTGNSR